MTGDCLQQEYEHALWMTESSVMRISATARWIFVDPNGGGRSRRTCSNHKPARQQNPVPVHIGERLDAAARVGDAKGVKFKLGDVVRGSNGIVGDVWIYARTFRPQAMDVIHVRKEVTLTAIDPLTYALTFSVPGGQTIDTKADTKMVTISDVLTPGSLETCLLDIDEQVGRNERPNGHAWKSFRVRRNGQDLGTLFEIRQKCHRSTPVDR
ncbi:hypothetical protein YB2330_002671 [Saitoella coloradoensis]